jgi:predicted MFS family arabinose efflux permease
MLADLFRKPSRPLALAILGTANSLAFIAFFPVVGWIGEQHGWRQMFVAAGLPGIVLALVFFLTVREPTRGAAEELPQRLARESLFGTIRFLAGSRAFLLMALGAMFMGANAYAAGTWSAAFLMRVHGLSLSEIASWTGPLRGVLGGAGILLGGVLTDRLSRRDARWRLGIPAIACLLVAPAEVLFLLGDRTPLWTTGFALTSLFTLLHQAPVFAAAMSVARVNMRAVAISILVLFASLLGQVIGPVLVGFLNDQLQPVVGDTAIRYSLLVIAASALAAGLSFWAAIRFLEADARR